MALAIYPRQVVIPDLEIQSGQGNLISYIVTVSYSSIYQMAGARFRKIREHEMKFSTIIGPLMQLRYIFLRAIGPTLRDVFKEPWILFHPKRLSRLFFNHVWVCFGGLIDEGGKDTKRDLIKDVKGSVLDIGAGS